MTSRNALPEKASVVIIGGGIIGVSALYHLTKKNVTDAVLVERKSLGSGTTWHAAGIVGQLRENSAQTELSKYTAKLFRELEIETGQATGYKQNGTMHIAVSDIRWEQLRRSHDHAARMQIEGKLLKADEIHEIYPHVDLTGVRGGFLVPSNGQVNPLDVTQALAKGARAGGGEILNYTKATRILVTKGKVCGVETNCGVIATEKVLLAGGMWAAKLAKDHGVTLPLHAAEHFYIVTEAIPGLSKTLPGLVSLEERLYTKEDAGKLLVGGFEARGKAWGTEGIPEDFEFDQLPFDIDHVEPVLEKFYARFPILHETGIHTFFNGPESFTIDGAPYIGPSSELNGLYIAAGMNSNGILNSGGVGLTLAAWITEGMPPRAVSSMLAARAHPFQKNTPYNAERVTEAVGLHWGLQWHGRQIETARGIRRVPLHKELLSAGATMFERIGWEVPAYFDPDQKGWSKTPSIGWQDWSPLVMQECLAARDAAIFIDQSMYGKILVQGPDAMTALNHICGVQMDVAIGTSIYTQFLNSRGGIEADVTVTRIGQQKYIIVTGHPSQMRDQAFIQAHANPAWQFEVFDATSAFSLLTLHGPKSRTILQAITNDDLSNDVFVFAAAREIDLAYARTWAIRRSYLGELGFELLIPTEFTEHIYAAILEEGRHHGLRHGGMFAMNACRIEKGFRHFGHDIGQEDTPYESGLGFAVDLNKPSFVGRDSLARQVEEEGQATKSRMVSIRVPDLTARNGPYLIHNEPVWKGNKRVGHVTSGGWGWRLEAMVGLASLHQDDGVSRDWIESGGFEVQIAGEKYTAELQLQPFYDHAGHKMRG